MAGSKVKLEGPPEKIVEIPFPLTEQSSVNHEEVKFTGSLKFTIRLAPTGKSVAPLTGYVLETSGAASAAEHALRGEAVLRGAGVLFAKSDALLSVSLQPLLSRNAANVFDRLGVVGLLS
jgi:hypothetical protein